MFEYGGLSVHIIFFYFKEYGMTYCIISKCQEREDQFERINFLFLNLLEKSLIPTNINIVFVVISHNSLYLSNEKHQKEKTGP